MWKGSLQVMKVIPSKKKEKKNPPPPSPQTYLAMSEFEYQGQGLLKMKLYKEVAALKCWGIGR